MKFLQTVQSVLVVTFFIALLAFSNPLSVSAVRNLDDEGGGGGGGGGTTTTAPTAALTASPTSVVSGSTTLISWSSTNATSCTGTNFSTGNAVSGSVSLAPTTTTTYSVSCTGTGGTTSASVTVTVTYVSSTTAPSTSNIITYGSDPNCRMTVTTGTTIPFTVEMTNQTGIAYETYAIGTTGGGTPSSGSGYSTSPNGSYSLSIQWNTPGDYLVYGSVPGIGYGYYPGNGGGHVGVKLTAGPYGSATYATSDDQLGSNSVPRCGVTVVAPTSANISCSAAPSNATTGQNVTWSASGAIGTWYALTITGNLVGIPGSNGQGSFEGQGAPNVSSLSGAPSCSSSQTPGSACYVGDWVCTTGSGYRGCSPGVTYSWSGTDSLSGTGTTTVKSYTTVGTKTATVTVTPVGGGQASTNSCTTTIGAPAAALNPPTIGGPTTGSINTAYPFSFVAN